MSSQYPVLGNKLDLVQLKVTELKEELKRRKLKTSGLKDDLVKRLEEAIRIEREDEEIRNELVNAAVVAEGVDNGVDLENLHVVGVKNAEAVLAVTETVEVVVDDAANRDEKVGAQPQLPLFLDLLTSQTERNPPISTEGIPFPAASSPFGLQPPATPGEPHNSSRAPPPQSRPHHLLSSDDLHRRNLRLLASSSTNSSPSSSSGAHRSDPLSNQESTAGPATSREQRSREEGETKNKADPKRR